MKNHQTNRSSQAGIVMIMMTVGMVVLLGVSGLALDMGHAYLMKTRLQNALDAAALSGAKSRDEGLDTTQAEIDAKATFSINAGDDMNDTGLIPVVEFSDILFDPSLTSDPKYVRVSLAGYQQPMWFAQVLPGVGNNKEVTASAVAGPSPALTTICDLVPVMVCGDPDHDTPCTDPDCDPTDPDAVCVDQGCVDDYKDCSDGDCWGYSPSATEEIVLKTGSNANGNGNGNDNDIDWEVGPGNFQLINLGNSKGGSDVRHNLAGGFEDCINTDNNIQTAPGNTVGPVAQGLNTRFGEYHGPLNQYKDDYRPDLITTTLSTNDPPQYYSDYVNYTGSYHPDGVANRRILGVPIGDCSLTTHGSGTLPLLGVACFFLTQPAEQNGSQRIYGQIIPGCEAHGTPGNDTGASGPKIIQLYKDPASGDA